MAHKDVGSRCSNGNVGETVKETKLLNALLLFSLCMQVYHKKSEHNINILCLAAWKAAAYLCLPKFCFMCNSGPLCKIKLKIMTIKQHHGNDNGKFKCK